jgi:hypothetical protein
VVGAVAAAAVTLAAGPAFAKGSMGITAPRTAHVAGTITVTAHASDDSAGYLHQLCLEENAFGEGWHQRNCSVVTGGNTRVTARGTAARSGDLRFRAVLYGLTGRRDHHRVRLHTSAVMTVRVR